MSSKTLNLYLTYQFLKRLATPFDEWPAYKLGIIDAEGNALKKSATFTSPEEDRAWGPFDRLVARIKRLLGKLPGGKTKFASYAAALLLIREYHNPSNLEDDDLLYEALIVEYDRVLNEDGEGATPVNNVGSGKIAGLGVGPQGEPPKKILINKMFKRKMLQNVDTKLSP